MTLTHLGSVELQTPRLILRPFTMSDAPELFDSCLSDPLVTRYISIPTHATPKQTEELLQKTVLAYHQPAYYYWALVPKTGGNVAGAMLTLNNDERSHKCEVGYYLSREWWGQGLIPEALGAVIDFLFERVGYLRLEARCDAANAGSARVLEKCGFFQEGLLRKSFFNNAGVYVDSRFFGLLREDRQKSAAGDEKKIRLMRNSLLTRIRVCVIIKIAVIMGFCCYFCFSPSVHAV